MRKKIVFLLLGYFTTFFVTDVLAENNLCAYYPHWNCAISTQAKIISAIEKFIVEHPHKGIVAFDWDGTLYDEHIPNPDNPRDDRAGQPIWHIWGANHLATYRYLFPAFKNGNGSIDEQAQAIKRQDDYVEAKLFQPLNAEKSQLLSPVYYDKFVQISRFEVGMSLPQMNYAVNKYLKDYSPKDYAFKKMLDIVQRLNDVGFTTWIITGSNVYFLANVLNAQYGLNNILGYHLFSSCRPRPENLSKFYQNCFIAGNAAKLLKIPHTNQYIFSMVYDDRFLNKELKNNEVASVDGYGKALVLKQLSQRFNQPVVLYAGNSDGDYEAIKYVLSGADNSVGMFVDVKSKSVGLISLLQSSRCKNKDSCIEVKDPRN